jgi:hypothetical protein
VGSGLFSIDGWSGAVLQRRFPAGGQARGGAVGHSFAAQGGMECCDRLRWRGSIKRGDHAAAAGVMTQTIRVHRGVWAAHAAGVEGRAGARQRIW